MEETDLGTHYYFHEQLQRSVRTVEEIRTVAPDGWVVYTDENGDTFYHNGTAGQTVWTLDEAIAKGKVLATTTETSTGLDSQPAPADNRHRIGDGSQPGTDAAKHIDESEIEKSLLVDKEEEEKAEKESMSISTRQGAQRMSAEISEQSANTLPEHSEQSPDRKFREGGSSKRRQRLRRLSKHRQAGYQVPSLAEFRSRPLNIVIVSWNVGNKLPEQSELHNLLHPNAQNVKPDIIVVGTQECKYHVTSRARARASTSDAISSVKRRKHSSALEDSDTLASDEEKGAFQGITSHSHWVNMVAATCGSNYMIVSKEHLLEMRLVILATPSAAAKLSAVSHTRKATGIAHVYGNKGGLVSALQFGGTTIGFVSCHLAAHSKFLHRRNRDCADILKFARVGNHKLDILAQCQHVFWFGDLNYRIDLTDSTDGNPEAAGNASIAHQEHFAKVQEMIDKRDWAGLYEHDQLHRSILAGKTLTQMKEKMPDFPPTFKVERGSSEMIYQEKRVPSWCDRILWSSMSKRVGKDLVCCRFESVPSVTTSDHKPVRAAFQVTLEEEVPLIPMKQEDRFGIIIKITNLSCLNLPVCDKSTKSSDPYVTFQTFPREICPTSHVMKTPVMTKSLNPVWRDTSIEIMTYVRSIRSLRTCYLIASVYDHDRFSADDDIGRVVLDLGELLANVEHGGEVETFNSGLSLNGVRVCGNGESRILGSISIVPPTSSEHKSLLANHPSRRSMLHRKRKNTETSEEGHYFTWETISGNSKDHNNGDIAPFTKYCSTGSIQSPNLQRRHRQSGPEYPEWEIMTGNVKQKTAPTRKSGLTFRTMASMVAVSTRLNSSMSKKDYPRKQSSGSTNSNKHPPLSRPTTSQQLRASEQQFATPSNDSSGGKPLRGTASLSPTSQMHEAASVSHVQHLSFTPEHSRSRARGRRPQSEPKSRHTKLRPMNSKICGWLQKRNSRKIFGRSVWRNRWFVLDQRKRILDYYKDPRIANVDSIGASQSGFGDIDSNTHHAHIDMTKHRIHNVGPLEWELRPDVDDVEETLQSREAGNNPTTAKSKEFGRVWVFRADDHDHKQMWIASMKLCSKDGLSDWLARSHGLPSLQNTESV